MNVELCLSFSSRLRVLKCSKYLPERRLLSSTRPLCAASHSLSNVGQVQIPDKHLSSELTIGPHDERTYCATLTFHLTGTHYSIDALITQ